NVSPMRVHDGEPRLLPCTKHLLERSARRIELFVRVLLPAVQPQVLVEVALRVEQPHADEWNPEVRRRLAMVPSKHTETTGVDGHGVVEPELCAEVRDRAAR